MSEKIISSEVSHRDHPFRKLVSKFEKYSPNIIEGLNSLGLLHETQIEQAYLNETKPTPDDVSLTGLQLIVRSAKSFISGKSYPKIIPIYLLGCSMDGLDGALARSQQTGSPDGAVHDVVTDRITDYSLAEIILDTIGKSDGNESVTLIKKFTLSTLTKAACEMGGIQTSEGGRGSIIERRDYLFDVLVLLNSISYRSKFAGFLDSNSIAKTQKQKVKIFQKINTLIENSDSRAKERANQLISSDFADDLTKNPTLQNPKSGAAIEAKKYAVICLMLKDKYDIDIVESLNHLNPQVTYPTVEKLASTFSYIQDCITNTNQFVNNAYTLAHEK